jgi:hypothetical protein
MKLMPESLLRISLPNNLQKLQLIEKTSTFIANKFR